MMNSGKEFHPWSLETFLHYKMHCCWVSYWRRYNFDDKRGCVSHSDGILLLFMDQLSFLVCRGARPFMIRESVLELHFSLLNMKMQRIYHTMIPGYQPQLSIICL